MRIAAVGDIHGRQHLEALRRNLADLEPPDLFLLAGDTTDRNDLDAFGEVIASIRQRVAAPIWAVFGNNEYAESHETYRARFANRHAIRFLADEEAVFASGDGGRIRVVGSLGSLDRPTWWQRKNLPHLAGEYERRIGTLDRLLTGDEPRLLLTHYPPTYATMGGEKPEWRPELGCRSLEPILLRRRPTFVVHGHIHKGIPRADLREPRGGLDAFLEDVPGVPIHNVAYPVRKAISVLDV